jgi:hypothetical protein
MLARPPHIMQEADGWHLRIGLDTEGPFSTRAQAALRWGSYFRNTM